MGECMVSSTLFIEYQPITFISGRNQSVDNGLFLQLSRYLFIKSKELKLVYKSCTSSVTF